jgi:hypothetical protein
MNGVSRMLRVGMARTLEGFSPKLAIAIGVLSTVVALALAVSSAKREGNLGAVPVLTASVLAWGTGVLLCFAASMRAFARDREEGWRALLARHGFGDGAYLGARIGGLALVVVLVDGIGTALVGVTALLGAHDHAALSDALSGTVASLAYSIAFALVVAPVAVATLAPRPRGAGYLFLLSVLVVPALVAGWTSELVPEGWGELVSIPGALDALREGLQGSPDPTRVVRAAAVLAIVAIGAVGWARAQLSIRGAAR